MTEVPATEAAATAAVRAKRNRRTAVITLSVVFGMVGASFAAVPLYELFCQVTGYGGTTQRADGESDRILERVVKVLGMVNCPPDFNEMPKVINGFSDLFVELLGEERGRGARSAVGMVSLPNQIAVEVEMVLQIRD